MDDHKVRRQTVLIADDSEMNRMLLIEMLGDSYDVLEAEDGVAAAAILKSQHQHISLLLLDLMMPNMDGFSVLRMMREEGWTEDIPVIVISAESLPENIHLAYDLGVTDFIARPFDAVVVQNRVENTLLLAAKQERLEEMVEELARKKEQSERLLINVLSQAVEFRNGESGMHVQNVGDLTQMLLRTWASKWDGLTEDDINRITLASAMHDIGKISIDSDILNKPGRFTNEEFAVMKTHTTIGADMLDALSPEQRDTSLVRTVYEICRWHHERWDGRGYPDGLAGERIPLSARVVALADVYDALTSERCYKKAFPHEKAVEMILNGECGAFDPRLLECFREVAPLWKELSKKKEGA